MADTRRRPRFKRAPTGKNIRLQHRDYEVLRLLYRYRYLSSQRLTDFLAPDNPKKLVERLGDLFHETSLVDRPVIQQKRSGIGSGHAIYCLTKNGLYTLLERDVAFADLDPVLPLREDPHGAHRLLEHTVQISDVLSSIELSCLGNSGRRYITEGEILRRLTGSEDASPALPDLSVNIPPSRFVPHQKNAVRLRIVPDALFGIQHGNGSDSLYQFYALEVECTNPLRRRTLTKPSYVRKLLAYRELIYSNLGRDVLKIPHLTVIFASSDPAKLQAMIDLASQIWNEEEQRFVLFRPLDEPGPTSCVEITDKWLKHFET